MRSPLSRFQTPTTPRRVSRFFRVWLLAELPQPANHSVYFGLAKFYLSQPFQPSTQSTLNSYAKNVNAAFRCILEIPPLGGPRMQSVELLMVSECQERLFLFFHTVIHRCSTAFLPKQVLHTRWRNQPCILTGETKSCMVKAATGKCQN
jgi:hypothetical protein